MKYPKRVQERLNKSLSFIHLEDRKYLNCLRLDRTDIDCWDQMYELFKEFRRLGIPVLTQARIIREGKVIGKADVITPLDYIAYEVLNTESEERFKSKDYSPFTKIKIRLK